MTFLFLFTVLPSVQQTNAQLQSLLTEIGSVIGITEGKIMAVIKSVNRLKEMPKDDLPLSLVL